MSEPRRAALELVEGHLDLLRAEAAEGDRTRRFPIETARAFQASGLTAATVSTELGGGGITAISDLMAVAERIGQVDSSLGIATNMHLGFTWGLGRAARAGVAGAETHLRRIVAGEVWNAATVTEAGTNYFHPAATLTPDGDGWTVSGDKVFATASPAATHFSVNARATAGPLAGRLTTVVIAADTPGVRVHDDWNGLGMRSSGSGRVTYDKVALGPDTLIIPGGTWGEFTPAGLCGRAFGNAGNVAAIAGVARAARDHAVDRIRSDKRVGDNALSERAPVRQSLGELDTDLYALEAVIDLLGKNMDAAAADTPTDLEAAYDVMARFQAAKANVNRLATQIVNRSMDLSGGAGYVDDHPIARRYRDVRAGSFMQPFSPHEAQAFIGAVRAGIAPDPLA